MRCYSHLGKHAVSLKKNEKTQKSGREKMQSSSKPKGTAESNTWIPNT